MFSLMSFISGPGTKALFKSTSDCLPSHLTNGCKSLRKLFWASSVWRTSHFMIAISNDLL